MSTGNPPKGSDGWVAERDGGENAPAPTESKTTPQSDVAPPADKGVGVSPQDNADAVMGYDRQIATLQELANKYRPETKEEREKRERKEKSKKTVAAVGDGLMALSNLYFTSKGAPNMYNHRATGMQARLQKRLDEARKEREANADKYLQYSLKIGDLQNERGKTLREMEAQQEARKLAREKALREQEAHGWLAARQPDIQREQAGKAAKAEQEAVTAKAEADNAPGLYKAKVDTEKSRGVAQRAAAANSSASARAHDRSNVSEFSAWDENGVEHRFRTKDAATAYAKQHGTYEEENETSTRTTDADVTVRGRVVKDDNGEPVRKSSTVTTAKPAGYPRRPAAQGSQNGNDNTSPSGENWASGLVLE